jgi:two-component system, NtrC family, sensor kinase
LVSLIEANTDRIFGRLQGATTVLREQLVDLEGKGLRWSVALLVALPLFVAGAVFYLSRSIARPLAQLSEGAAALAGGDLDARIDIDSPDEFGALAAEFNAMTVALKQHQERLVESEKLAGIGRLAAGMAHELNNPLQVMLGYLSLNRDLPDRRLAEQLAATEAEALRCKEIIDGLRELARPTVTPAPVDLRHLCEDIAAGLRVSMQPATPRVFVDGSAVALGDGPKVRQVVFNLMKNAVEAAGPGGDVTVGLEGEGDRVEVAIRDSGPGVSAEARAQLFEPSFTTKPTGTGLGLAVSRAIARAHGGDIEVRNGEAGGATFTLRLPRAQGVQR